MFQLYKIQILFHGIPLRSNIFLRLKLQQPRVRLSACDITNEMGFRLLLGNVTDNFTGHLLGGSQVNRRKNGMKVFVKILNFFYNYKLFYNILLI